MEREFRYNYSHSYPRSSHREDTFSRSSDFRSRQQRPSNSFSFEYDRQHIRNSELAYPDEPFHRSSPVSSRLHYHPPEHFSRQSYYRKPKSPRHLQQYGTRTEYHHYATGQHSNRKCHSPLPSERILYQQNDVRSRETLQSYHKEPEIDSYYYPSAAEKSLQWNQDRILPHSHSLDHLSVFSRLDNSTNDSNDKPVLPDLREEILYNTRPSKPQSSSLESPNNKELFINNDALFSVIDEISIDSNIEPQPSPLIESSLICQSPLVESTYTPQVQDIMQPPSSTESFLTCPLPLLDSAPSPLMHQSPLLDSAPSPLMRQSPLLDSPITESSLTPLVESTYTQPLEPTPLILESSLAHQSSLPSASHTNSLIHQSHFTEPQALQAFSQLIQEIEHSLHNSSPVHVKSPQPLFEQPLQLETVDHLYSTNGRSSEPMDLSSPISPHDLCIITDHIPFTNNVPLLNNCSSSNQSLTPRDGISTNQSNLDGHSVNNDITPVDQLSNDVVLISVESNNDVKPVEIVNDVEPVEIVNDVEPGEIVNDVEEGEIVNDVEEGEIISDVEEGEIVQSPQEYKLSSVKQPTYIFKSKAVFRRKYQHSHAYQHNHEIISRGVRKRDNRRRYRPKRIPNKTKRQSRLPSVDEDKELLELRNKALLTMVKHHQHKDASDKESDCIPEQTCINVLPSVNDISIKVVPSLNDTWTVKEFKIIASDESDHEELQDASINSMIYACRKVAESGTATSNSNLIHKLSVITSALADCESESQSLEDTVVRLSEQLKEAQYVLSQCEQKKKLFQDEIRSIKCQIDGKSLANDLTKSKIQSPTVSSHVNKETENVKHKEKQQLLQTVTAKRKQLAQVKQKYLTLLKRSKKLQAKKMSLKIVSPPSSSDVLRSKSKIRRKSFSQSKHQNDSKSHKATEITALTQQHSETNLDVKQQMSSTFEQQNWTYNEKVYEQLKKWSPSVRCTTCILSITDINIVTGKCFNLFPLPKLNYSYRELLNTKQNSKSQVSGPLLTQFQYTSPLLMFKAYRVNPLYRSEFKLPLSSQTHSNSINPHIPFCRFESKGRCNDPQCTAQHNNDIKLSEDNISQDMLQYIQEKPSELDKVVRSKMSDKEWLILTAHNVYKKINQHSIVSASEQWLNNEKSLLNSEVVSTNVCSFIPVPVDSSTFANFDTFDKKSGRYFNEIEEDMLISQIKENMRHGEMNVTLQLLEKAIKNDPINEELWILYVRMSCDETINKKAALNVPSYNVFKEIIRCSTEMKRYWISEAYKSISTLKTSEITSHHILELTCSYVQLDVILNDIPSALDSLKMIFTDTQLESLPGVLNNLVHCDRVYLGLTFLYLLTNHSLPCQLYGCHSNSIPIIINRKDPFFISWNKDSSVEECMEIFKIILKSCTEKDISNEQNILICTPIYLNLFVYEILHCKQHSTLLSLTKLINVAPFSYQLQLFRFSLIASQECVSDLVHKCSITHPLMYYTLACLYINQSQKDKAIESLVSCLTLYFSNLVADSVLLYRKLLGLSTPYTFQSPPLSNDHDINDHIVYIWLCYCLLEQLTSPENTEDIYELAVNSVHPGRVGYCQIWLDYLNYLLTRFHSLKTFAEVIKRSVQLIQDSKFHHDVVNLLDNTVNDANDIVTILLFLLKTFPSNQVFITKYLEYSIKHNSIDIDGVYLCYSNSNTVEQRLLLISCEISLHHYREARWLYQQLIQSQPLHVKTWNEYLLFELSGIIHGYSSQSLINSLISQSQKYNISLTLQVVHPQVMFTF